MATQLYFVHVLSPLHAGVGQGSGVIDLPIAREKATGIPYLPGSSVKGVLRDRSGDNALTYALFGPKTENASEHAGSLQMADARLLLLPVRSVRGTFAWVTSPYILSRLARDAGDVGLKKIPPLPAVSDDTCDVVSNTCLKVNLPQTGGPKQDRVVIEDLDLKLSSQQAAAWEAWLKDTIFPVDDKAWPAMLEGRLCIVSDNVFSFLLTTAVEVIARNRLDTDRKTVAKGALWYEEALPTETVLYGVAVLAPTRKVREHEAHHEAGLLAHLNMLAEGAMQFGGKATVGRGLCRLRLAGSER